MLIVYYYIKFQAECPEKIGKKTEGFAKQFAFLRLQSMHGYITFHRRAYTDCRGGQRPDWTILHTSGFAPLKRDEKFERFPLTGEMLI